MLRARRSVLLSWLTCILACSGNIRNIDPPSPGLPDDPDEDDRGDPDAGAIAITSPEDNVLTAASSIEVVGEVREGDFTEVDVQGAATRVQADGTFTARVRLDEGRNEIHARAGSADAWIIVRRDTAPPVISITNPVRGAFVDALAHPRVELSGGIADAHGLRSVTVNGAPAEVDESGAFRFVDMNGESGVHYYSVVAEDNAGNVGATGLSILYGQFAPASEPAPDAIVALAGPSVLSAIGDGASAALEDVDLQATALASNPVLDEWWARIDLTWLTRGPISVEPVATEEGVRVTVRVDRIDLGFHCDLLGPYNPDGTAWASAAVVTGTVDVWATESGTIDAALVESSVVLEGFGFDVAPTGIEDMQMVHDYVEQQISTAVQSVVDERVPAILSEQLSMLDLSRSLDFRGISLWIDVRPTLLEIDRGGITIRADGALYGDDAGTTPAHPGTLRTPSASPSLSSDGLSVSFADDTINQVLSAAWVAGLLDREVRLSRHGEPITLATLTLVFPSLEGIAEASSPVIATLDPLLPPVATLEEQGATLSIGELHVKFEAETPAGRVDLATLAVKFDADLAASFGDGASVSLGIANWAIEADPVVTPDGFPQGQEFDELMQAIVGMIRPELEAPLTSLPLPGFAGFTYSGLQAHSDGERSDYLTVSCGIGYW